MHSSKLQARSQEKSSTHSREEGAVYQVQQNATVARQLENSSGRAFPAPPPRSGRGDRSGGLPRAGVPLVRPASSPGRPARARAAAAGSELASNGRGRGPTRSSRSPKPAGSPREHFRLPRPTLRSGRDPAAPSAHGPREQVRGTGTGSPAGSDPRPRRHSSASRPR